MNWITSSHNWFTNQLQKLEYDGTLEINGDLVPIKLTPVASGSVIDGEIEIKGNNKAFTIRTEIFDPRLLRQNMVVHFEGRKWRIVKDSVQGTDRFWYFNDPLNKTYTLLTCEAPS